MLAFHYHIGLSLALLAFGVGAAILIWSKIHANLGTGLAKLIAYLIIILSVINILCASYYGLKYWSAGYMDKPFPVMAQTQMPPRGMMMPCPMMQQMMSGQMMDNKTMPCPMMQQMMKDKNMPNQTMQQPTMPEQMMNNQTMQNQTLQMDVNKTSQNSTTEIQQNPSPSAPVDHTLHHN